MMLGTGTARRLVLSCAPPVGATALALALTALVLVVSGSDPLAAYSDMLRHASRLETVVDILNRATPLYLSGVAAAIGFRMNLFNIGTEGQYLLAFVVAAQVGALTTLPPVLHVTLVLAVAMTVGAVSAGVAGVLKVARGVHEVISTIMLNAVAVSGLVAWLVVAWRADSGTGSGGAARRVGTAPMADSAVLPDINRLLELFTREIGKGRQLTGMLLVAAAVCVLYFILLNRTVFGFDLRVVGINPAAAHAGGVPPGRMTVLTMLLSGAVAGLVGMPELMGTGYFPANPVMQLGFTGIAVALLGRNHPAGVAFGALVFAFLDKSSSVLQITGSASREIVVITQGVTILTAVIGYEVVLRIRHREEAAAATRARGGPT